MSDKVIYCRRMINDTTAPQGEYPCGLKIETANPLDWCDECRKRLPLWPEETREVLHAAPCRCGSESEFLCYPEDGQCACGTYKHHVHCAKCHGVSQWG